MSVEDLRKQNMDEAKELYKYIAEIIESGVMPWDWRKKRKERTELVLSMMSLLRLLRGENVFFDPRHFEGVIKWWKIFVEKYPEMDKWIKIYEERSREKSKIAEIGERLVDLSSSPFSPPVYLSMAFEYEPLPRWGQITQEFHKLLNVLAHVKVGMFHLPAWQSTDELWYHDEKTGKLKWESKVLHGDKPEELIESMKEELGNNELEHPYTVYLITFLRALTEKEVNLRGYLLWKEPAGEVFSETLETKTFTF